MIEVEPGQKAIWLQDEKHWSFKYFTRVREFEHQQVMVQRRYSDFVWLQKALQVVYAGCSVPVLPPKSVYMRFSNDDSELI